MLYVLLPAYNEEEALTLLLPRIRQVIEQHRLTGQIIVVDDGCTDRTLEIARSWGADKVLSHSQNLGLAAALRTGLSHTARIAETDDIIVTMDGDGTYPRAFVPILLDVLVEENLDFISCDRTGHKAEESNSFLRLLGNSILNLALFALFFIRLKDSQSGMWVFRRSILPKLDLTSDAMALSEEIKVEAFGNKDLRARELPIYYRRRVGESKLNLWHDGFGNLFFLFRKRFRG